MSVSPNEEGWETVATAAALQRAGLMEVAAGGTVVLLAWVDGASWAAHGLCPHQFARLRDGRVEGGRLHCPRHHASFDLRTGAPDDRWQIAGLRLYPARLRGGAVQVDLSPGERKT
jgi:3-phenylpropionate/trans-cinnamate dioxygenase ferredoxin component